MDGQDQQTPDAIRAVHGVNMEHAEAVKLIKDYGFAVLKHQNNWLGEAYEALLRALLSASIADTAGAKQDDVMDALDIAEQLDEMSDRITRFSNYEGDAVCARAAQLLRTFANHQAARRKVMSDGDLQDIVMGLFGRYTIPADYKLANSVAEFVMSKLPRSAPYGAPFTTDVAHCCGDPETCNDPCEPAIDTAGANQVLTAHIINGEVIDVEYTGNLMDGEYALYTARPSLTEGQQATLLACAFKFEAEGNKPMAEDVRSLLAQSAEQDRIDSERWRFLRDKMRFSSPPGDIPTMTLSAPLEAPTHDTHKDWISDRFDASVDRTIDAAMEREND
jgi:hypothetical protein